MADPTRRPEWTDEQIRLVGVAVTRLYLEVERGLRNREHLRRFLTPLAYGAQFSDTVSRFPDAGPVQSDDLGAVTYTRTDPSRAMLTVVARQHADRWGAVCVELRPDPRGCWRITELTRAQDRNLAHPTPDPPDTPDDSQRQQRLRAMELQAIRAALTTANDRHAAAQAALDDLRATTHPDAAAVAAAQQRLTAAEEERHRWASQLAGLPAAALTDGADEAGRPRHPAYVTRLLGPQPTDDNAKAVWNAGAGILEVYRRAAGITDHRTALGPTPADPALADARNVALRHLSDLTHHLQVDTARAPRHLTGQERALEPVTLQR